MKHLGFEVVERALRWAKARAQLRHLLDSKSAKPDQVAKAKAAYVKASDELEKIVVYVDQLKKKGALKKAPGDKKPFDWQGFMNVAFAGAQAIEHVVTATKGGVKPLQGEIIDVDFEVIEKK